MKKARSKKKPANVPMSQPVQPSCAAPREDHDPLKPGDIVMLPDGAVAAIERIVGANAYVVEWTKQIGRGPWIFPISELVPVS